MKHYTSSTNYRQPCPPQGIHSGIAGQSLIYFAAGAVGFSHDPAQISPYPTSVRIYSHGRLVRTVDTDVHGRFEVRLHPGEYHLVPLQPAFSVVAPIYTAPVDVTVTRHEFTSITIWYWLIIPGGPLLELLGSLNGARHFGAKELGAGDRKRPATLLLLACACFVSAGELS
jgi:hypothetical protein